MFGGIADLAQKVLEVYFAIPKEERAKQINITVSTSSFVPKPFTAFQWANRIHVICLSKSRIH